MARGDIGNIQLNQSAAFYKLKAPRRYLLGLRTMLHNAAARDTGSPLYYVYEYRKEVVIGGHKLLFSLCVFKYTSKSPLFVQDVPDYKEQHVGYLMIVEYGDYVTISNMA